MRGRSWSLAGTHGVVLASIVGSALAGCAFEPSGGPDDAIRSDSPAQVDARATPDALDGPAGPDARDDAGGGPDAAAPDARALDAPSLPPDAPALPPDAPAPPDDVVAHLAPDDEAPGTGPLVLGAVTIDTSELTIGGAAPPAGVVLERVTAEDGTDVAVLRVATLSIPDGIVVVVKGARPLVVIAADTITIAGELDASAALAVPGPGGAGPSGGDGAGGDGQHAIVTLDSGGGGAGGGTAGAPGGAARNAVLTAPGGAPGAQTGTPSLDVLAGGSGGGAGGTLDVIACTAPAGGAGGGALQLSARGLLHVTATGRVHAGGGGGAGGGPCLTETQAGAGGGAGGAIYLEAPSVIVDGVVAANGGGGGSSAGDALGAAGDDALASSIPAPGGESTGRGSRGGGAGGAGAIAPTAGTPSGRARDAGGGGGAFGRIAVRLPAGIPVGGAGTISPFPTVLTTP